MGVMLQRRAVSSEAFKDAFIRFVGLRDHRQGQMMAVIILVATSTVLVLSSLADVYRRHPFVFVSAPHEHQGSIMHLVALPSLLILIWLGIRNANGRLTALIGAPLILGSVLMIAVFASWTKDDTMTGQVLFSFPVVFAAYAFRARFAWLTMGCAVIGQFVVAVSSTPLLAALDDWFTAAIILAGVTALLVRSRNRSEAVEAELRFRRDHDDLTGLVNRQVFDHRMDELDRGPVAGAGVALLVADVDHFKRINDTCGHMVGDRVLMAAAQVLKEVAGPTGMPCRLGGDELVIVLPNCGLRQATVVAEQLVARMRELGVEDDHLEPVPVTSSVGLAHAPTHCAQAGTLYGLADKGLYRAKRAGRNGWQMCQAADLAS